MPIPEFALMVTLPAAVMAVAMAVDRWWGEPPARLHPVVGMGVMLQGLGRWAAPPEGTPRSGRWGPWWRGTLGWCAGAVAVVGLATLLTSWMASWPGWAQILVMGLFLKSLLAWRLLREEVLAVEHSLNVSLDAGRAQLARLVSRDVTGLDEAGVREAALSTLAENLNDSVVAPLFWFAVAGLPGAALYRWANTADAMWGYRGTRHGRVWSWAGQWAARTDDVLSWLPARITAAVMWVVARGWRTSRWSVLQAEAARTPSPNGGWPMGALALLLPVRLGKTGVYVLNAGAARPQPMHVQAAVTLCGRVVAWALWLLAGLATAWHMGRLA